jgi:F-type H+-transporting ATPase subunit b
MSVVTLGFQIVNFLVLAAVLRRFLFRPVAAMIARRQSEIDSVRQEAESGKRAAEESRARYERDVDRVHAEREALLAEARAEATRERATALEQARAEAARLLDEARGTIDRERSEAAARLADTAIRLAADLAKRLLQQATGHAAAEGLVERVCEHLEAMPADRLDALREELRSASVGSFEVATAPALSPEAEARFGARLAKDLGTASAARFVADSDLVAGAELRLPHTRISFSWRDGLKAAREELSAHAVDR